MDLITQIRENTNMKMQSAIKKFQFVVVCFFISISLLLFGISSAQADKDKIYNWKMIVNSKQNENYYRVVTETAKAIKKISNDRINIQPYALNMIVPITEAWESVDKGIIELALVFPGYHAGKMPVADVEAGLPYTLNNELELRMFWHDYGFLDFLNNEVYAKTNTHVLGQCYFSGYAFWLNKPATTVADLKKMKLRTAGSLSKVMGKLDIPAVFVPGAELYSALSTGVLDGAAYGSLVTGTDMKLYEVSKFVMEPKVQAVSECSIYINKRLFNSLPEDLKELMKWFALKINDGLNRDFDMGEIKIINRLKKEHNLKITTLDNEAVDALKQAAADYRKEIADKDPLTGKAIEMLDKFLKEVQTKQ